MTRRRIAALLGALATAGLGSLAGSCSGTVEPFDVDAAHARADATPAPPDAASGGGDAAVVGRDAAGSAGLDAAAAPGPDAAAPAGPDAAAPAGPDVGVDAGPEILCPPVGPLDCSPGSGDGLNCYDTPSCFYPKVRDTTNACVAQNPAWFDTTGGGSALVLADHVEDYMNWVVASLNGQNLCAIRDPNAGDEIVVKHDNSYSENFDILTADNYVRNGGACKTATCAPAWF